ncbi:MAG: aldo/keto reductase [Actinobacteria bacterium]|nr:aldo/keto reductase [Actinomycetota bacterium]NBY57696.1 aldo/keto reductase [Actinomycetota bacterium]
MVTMSFGRYGLGLWRFTTESLSDAARLVSTAVDHGITLLDNAAVYGGNWGGRGFGAAEELLGAVLAQSPALRDRVCVATKGGITPGIPYDQSPVTLRRECEDSLRRLRIERIDLYQIHRPDVFAHPRETAETLMALRREGKIDRIGVSNFTPAQHEALAAHLEVPIETTQPEYSAAALGPLRDGTFDLCMRDGVIPLAWSPLAGGRLVTGQNVRPDLLAVLDEIAAAHGTTREQVAYAFVLSHPAKPVVLLGTQKPERLVAAVSSPVQSLQRSELYRIVAASEGRPLP